MLSLYFVYLDWAENTVYFVYLLPQSQDTHSMGTTRSYQRAAGEGKVAVFREFSFDFSQL